MTLLPTGWVKYRSNVDKLFSTEAQWQRPVVTLVVSADVLFPVNADFSFLSFRLIPKKLMSSYTGMEECQKTNTNTKRKM